MIVSLSLLSPFSMCPSVSITTWGRSPPPNPRAWGRFQDPFKGAGSCRSQVPAGFFSLHGNPLKPLTLAAKRHQTSHITPNPPLIPNKQLPSHAPPPSLTALNLKGKDQMKEEGAVLWGPYAAIQTLSDSLLIPGSVPETCLLSFHPSWPRLLISIPSHRIPPTPHLF